MARRTPAPEKIDGAVAAIMAIGRASAGETSVSVYEAERRGFLFV